MLYDNWAYFVDNYLNFFYNRFGEKDEIEGKPNHDCHQANTE